MKSEHKIIRTPTSKIKVKCWRDGQPQFAYKHGLRNRGSTFQRFGQRTRFHETWLPSLKALKVQKQLAKYTLPAISEDVKHKQILLSTNQTLCLHFARQPISVLLSEKHDVVIPVAVGESTSYVSPCHEIILYPKHLQIFLHNE